MANDKYSLTYKALDEIPDVATPLVSGTDSLIVIRGGKPYVVDLDDFIDFIS
jgi:hypothetical protein